MGSEAKGIMYVPVWIDGGVVKALVLDDGSLPITEQSPLTTIQARLYGDLNDVWEKVHVLSDGSLRVFIGGAADDTEVIQNNPSDLRVGEHGYTGSAWKKQGMVWSYNDRYMEGLYNNNCAVGINDLIGSTVPSGEIWRVTGVSLLSSSGSCAEARVNAYMPPQSIPVSNVFPPVSLQVYAWVTDVVLKEGDNMQTRFYTMTLNDSIYTWYYGYKMKIDM